MNYEEYGFKVEPIKLSINVNLVKDGGDFIIATTEETEKLIGQSAYAQGKSLEEAESEFWKMIRILNEHYKERAHELDKWKPFQKGDWGHIGGTWFTVFGIHVYFRYGDNMMYGWYVPFTKLNISINNYWRKRKLK